LETEKSLEVKSYKVYYKTFNGHVRAVDGVDLNVHQGEIVGLIGESGCGKSTLAQSIILLRPPMEYMGGSVILNGRYDLTKMSPEKRKEIMLKEIALIPQYALDALPIIKKIRVFVNDLARDKGFNEKELLEIFKERLRQVNLTERILDMYPLELSGGMKQRVVIAVSTLFRPRLLIADEPASALDVVTQRQVLELLKQLRDDGIVGSLLFITHDIASIVQIADKIATMYAGKVVEVGSAETIIKEPQHPYTFLLINSIPLLGVSYKEKRLTGLGGAPPNLLNPPSGCRFHPRCPYAMPKCSEEQPPLTNLGEGHSVFCWLYERG